MPTTDTSVAEAVRTLDVTAAAGLTLDALPTDPGLYTLSLKSARAVADLGLEDLEPDVPLAARVLYLGKTSGACQSASLTSTSRPDGADTPPLGGRSARSSVFPQSRDRLASPSRREPNS